MNKVFSLKHLLYVCFILFFSVLIPLGNTNNVVTASAASINEDKQSDIKLNVKKKSLVTDTSYTLILYNLTDHHKVYFKSNDTDIATVNKEGVVTALKVGEATITVTVKEGSKTIDTLTCDITVGPPAISLKFKQADVTIVVSKSTLLDPILKPINTVEEIKFSSKDSKIATVSSSGRITAKEEGSTYIFGTINNGSFAKVLVTVVANEEIDTSYTTK